MPTPEPVPRIRLQLALDLCDLKRALKVCEQVHEFFDIIEIGTPLIKAAGVQAIAEAKAKYPNKTLVADMKTIDTGALDADLAFRNGADGIIFQGFAPTQTIKAVVDETVSQRKFAMIDSLGINDMIKFERIIEFSRANFAIVHTGIDEQRAGIKPLDRLTRLARSPKLPKLAVAGGISETTIDSIIQALGSGIIIIGAAVTKSESPEKVACSIRSKIDTFPN